MMGTGDKSIEFAVISREQNNESQSLRFGLVRSVGELGNSSK
jgi:hypothetical protein